VICALKGYVEGKDIWVEAASEEMCALKLYEHLADISSNE
jgi:hypothetical protein